jgi:hypothetical protein
VPTPPGPEHAPSASGTSDDPLADAQAGEWVRYRVTLGGNTTVMRLSVVEVTDGKVVFKKEIESGGGFLPPVPDELARGPILAALPQWGGVKESSHADAKVGEATADALLVTLDMGGIGAHLVFTNAVPALGLLRVEVNKQTLLEAYEWSTSPLLGPTTGVPILPPPGPPVPPLPAPEKPAAPAPSEGAEGGAVEIANPLVDAKVGEWMRFRQVVQGQETVVTLEVVEVTADEVVLKSTTQQGDTKVEGEPLRRKRSPQLALGRGRSTLVRKATESLTVNGRAVSCTVVVLQPRKGPEQTVWYSDEVPVTGLVKRARGTDVVQELLDWGRR